MITVGEIFIYLPVEFVTLEISTRGVKVNSHLNQLYSCLFFLESHLATHPTVHCIPCIYYGYTGRSCIDFYWHNLFLAGFTYMYMCMYSTSTPLILTLVCSSNTLQWASFWYHGIYKHGYMCINKIKSTSTHYYFVLLLTILCYLICSRNDCTEVTEGPEQGCC